MHFRNNDSNSYRRVDYFLKSNKFQNCSQKIPGLNNKRLISRQLKMKFNKRYYYLLIMVLLSM